MFNLEINFVGGLSPSQQSIFSTAESFWENIITGYQPAITLTGFTIAAEGAAIDGVGGILGSAGPDFVVNEGGYTLTSAGSMTFDSADLASLESGGTLLDVIKHEMGHVIGIGTLWDFGLNTLSTAGSGEYMGAAGLAAYQAEFDPLATFVPVELGGGAGTANGHWDEVDGGGALTGITDGDGNDMRDELMTGWLNTPSFISNTTIQSLVDLGYSVSSGAAAPEPSSLFLALMGSGLLSHTRKKKLQA